MTRVVVAEPARAATVLAFVLGRVLAEVSGEIARSAVQGLSSKQLVSAVHCPMTGICADAGAAITSNTRSPRPRSFRPLSRDVGLIRTVVMYREKVRLHFQSMSASPVERKTTPVGGDTPRAGATRRV